jgi:hypothetical protein
MTANFKRFVRNMILTVALIVTASMVVGCDGDALDADADKGAATWVWQCVVDTDPNTCSWK